MEWEFSHSSVCYHPFAPFCRKKKVRLQEWKNPNVFFFFSFEPDHPPGLLGCRDGPLVAALVSSGVVSALKRVQVADDGIRDHDEKGHHPCCSDHSVGVGPRLPHPWLQGVTDGAVAFNRYGNQAKRGDAHWYACRKGKKKSIVWWKYDFLLTTPCSWHCQTALSLIKDAAAMLGEDVLRNL